MGCKNMFCNKSTLERINYSKGVDLCKALLTLFQKDYIIHYATN